MPLENREGCGGVNGDENKRILDSYMTKLSISCWRYVSMLLTGNAVEIKEQEKMEIDCNGSFVAKRF